MVVLVVRGHARVSKQGYLVVVRTPERDEKTGKTVYRVRERVPILELESLVIVGSRVHVSTGLLLALAKAGVPVTIHGLEAEATVEPPFLQASAEARKAQHRVSESPQASLHLAKKLIKAKVQGLAALAAYLARKGILPQGALGEAERLRAAAPRLVDPAPTRRRLLEAEAELSQRAWSILRAAFPEHYGFQGRAPRSRDPVNASISYAYAILYSLSRHALTAAGLDPHIGLLHADRPGRSSLVYDYSEQFKPLAVHAVIRAARRKQLALSGDGLLDAESLEAVTASLHRLLSTRPRGRTRTNRAYIYIKAWELRNTMTQGAEYRPYTYSPG